VVEYAIGHPHHIPEYEILNLEVGLAGQQPGLLTAPRPVDRTMRMRLEALSDGPFAIGKTRLLARPSGFV